MDFGRVGAQRYMKYSFSDVLLFDIRTKEGNENLYIVNLKKERKVKIVSFGVFHLTVNILNHIHIFKAIISQD